jgi:hypothetical protein
MWPFRSRFRRALNQQAKSHFVIEPNECDDGNTISIDIYENMVESLAPRNLGRLSALILSQAESDGASRVRLCFGKNGMFYTIDGVEYEMVPPPSVVTVDMVRALVNESGFTHGTPGSLSVHFADRSVDLQFAIAGEPNDEYLEITGFTGQPPASILAAIKSNTDFDA